MANRRLAAYREPMQLKPSLVLPSVARALHVLQRPVPVAPVRILDWPADGQCRPLLLRGMVRLTAVTGRIWITRPGWPQDHWLLPGDSWVCHAPGPGRSLSIWISGEGESRITLKLEPIV